jgi:hypothetical protein
MSSKSENLLNFLSSGSSVTPNQIKKMFKLKNPSAAIHNLRVMGNPIYRQKVFLKKTGKITSKYYLASPNEMISFAVRSGFFLY